MNEMILFTTHFFVYSNYIKTMVIIITYLLSLIVELFQLPKRINSCIFE